MVGCAASIFSRPAKTFTLGFPDCPEVDEREIAKESARRFGTDHVELEVDNTCVDALPAITRHFGCPVGNPAALISFSLFRGMRNHTDTVVCGDGGNEIFGGVYKYNQVMNFVAQSDGAFLRKIIQGIGQKLWHQLRDTRLESLFQKGARLYFKNLGKNTDSASDSLDRDRFDKAVHFYALMESIWGSANKDALYTQETRTALSGHDSSKFLEHLFRHDDAVPLLQQLVYVRSNSFLPYNAIPYVEYNAVSNGVVPVFPLLDKKLMEFMYTVPFQYVYGKSPRYLMQQSLSRALVPAEIFRRPLKGFSTPVDYWLKTPKWKELVSNYLSPETIRKRGIFSPEYAKQLVNQFYAGKRYVKTGEGGKVQPLGLSIWNLIALEVWFQEFL